MNTINAATLVGTGFPPDEGRKLARALLEDDLLAEGIEVDLREVRPGVVISAFFNGFLQEVSERAVERLPIARSIRWMMKFPFQDRNVARWVRDFRPQHAA